MAATPYNQQGRRGFLPGNPGRPRGAKMRRTTVVRREARKRLAADAERLATATEAVVEAGEPHIREIVSVLAAAAKGGNIQAASLLMKHIAPPMPRSVVRQAEHLADLPPDIRMREIARAAARGEMSVEHAQILTGFAEKELETAILVPLRTAIRALQTGEDAGRAMQHLLAALDGLPQLREPPLIEKPTDD